MIDLVAVHGEMTRDGFRVTWDVDGDLRLAARASAVLTATIRQPWGDTTELSLVITPATTAQFVSELGAARSRITDQRVAECSVDEYSIETVFPRSWLSGFRNEVAIDATLSVDAAAPRSTVGIGFATSVAA